MRPQVDRTTRKNASLFCITNPTGHQGVFVQPFQSGGPDGMYGLRMVRHPLRPEERPPDRGRRQQYRRAEYRKSDQRRDEQDRDRDHERERAERPQQREGESRGGPSIDHEEAPDDSYDIRGTFQSPKPQSQRAHARILTCYTGQVS